MAENHQTLQDKYGQLLVESQKANDQKKYTFEQDTILSGDENIKAYQSARNSAAALRWDTHAQVPDQFTIHTIQGVANKMIALTEHWYNLSRERKREMSGWALKQLNEAIEALDLYTFSKNASGVSHHTCEDYNCLTEDAELHKEAYASARENVRADQAAIEGCLGFTEHSDTSRSLLAHTYRVWQIAIRALKDQEGSEMDGLCDALNDFNMEM
ncbi:hypothetical protein I302_105649 [Kwoniella bestiolae CBS 10118]|uniref:Uncharacterized protein n=1 Tax=Kwoniella bestiolae CBS 10118 TaxID=1296100 RepID=A0A1B9G1Q6_9TREE|nr:hypothetical protein I302_04766 [Kwoniella bestiolae CBS 10118]OCF24956.1 hypothetical protein I302_04766 [Kwoniella bestiolae CBS 10118]